MRWQKNKKRSLKISICLIKWLFRASAIPEISFCKKFQGSVMRDDRLRAVRTLPSFFLEEHWGCHRCRSNPVALPSYLLLLYVFSCSEHLMKDNLFGCLMLRHWLVEDYMRWSDDLWWLVVGWSEYLCWCVWGWVCLCVYIQWEFVSVFVSPGVYVCLFSSTSLFSTFCPQKSYFYDNTASLTLGRRLWFFFSFLQAITSIGCWKTKNLWISLFQDLWNSPHAKSSLFVLAAKRISDLPCEASHTQNSAKCYCELSQISHWQTLRTHKQTGAQRTMEVSWLSLSRAKETISFFTVHGTVF